MDRQRSTKDFHLVLSIFVDGVLPKNGRWYSDIVVNFLVLISFYVGSLLTGLMWREKLERT